MKLHRNAKTTPHMRALLVHRVRHPDSPLFRSAPGNGRNGKVYGGFRRNPDDADVVLDADLRDRMAPRISGVSPESAWLFPATAFAGCALSTTAFLKGRYPQGRDESL